MYINERLESYFQMISLLTWTGFCGGDFLFSPGASSAFNKEIFAQCIHHFLQKSNMATFLTLRLSLGSRKRLYSCVLPPEGTLDEI